MSYQNHWQPSTAGSPGVCSGRVVGEQGYCRRVEAVSNIVMSAVGLVYPFPGPKTWFSPNCGRDGLLPVAPHSVRSCAGAVLLKSSRILTDLGRE